MRNDQQAIMLYELREKILRKRMNTEEKIQSYLIEFSGCQEDIIYMANRILRFKQKLDDISDVVVQAQAYKYRIFVAKF
jgi:predicted nucleotide-binding protein (sugar kinase/HSP70/actin superfamily)